MKTLTAEERELLDQALGQVFSHPVTGYLFDATLSVLDGYATGYVFNHIKAVVIPDIFSDGSLIKTSEVFRPIRENGYWVFQTRNSIYIPVTWAEGGNILKPLERVE